MSELINSPALRAMLRKYRLDLIRAADRSATDLAKMMIEIERAMIATIENGGARGLTRGQINRVTEAIHRILLETNADLRRWMESGFKGAAGNGLSTQAAMLKEAFSVRAWSQIPVERVRVTFETFAEGIANGKLIRVSDPAIFAKHALEWNQHWVDTMRGVQREFTRAVATGDSWSNVAKRLTGPLNRLEIPKRIDPEAFARAYTRTKFTEIANNASTASASQAGIERFANLGVSDDRQSDICREASAQEPMTLDEWDESEWGRPPRHVFNCRCELVAVPDWATEEMLNV